MDNESVLGDNEEERTLTFPNQGQGRNPSIAAMRFEVVQTLSRPLAGS